MAKSKYPNKLDTSVEIPVIRDNITEIGSDVLNSLRSAIFNIEKTLGINPQGATGNTVASRLNNALDNNGNITKDALDRSGLLSGPISNEDVSKVAAISERKLNLDFPTQLLQDQISIIDNRIALFIISLEELNALLSAHVHPDAKNRHYAKAITIEPAIANPSSASARSLEEGTLQETLEELYNAHIHYTGEGVGSENNSHNAGQLFYNNEETMDIISSSSVQGAIDEIAGLQGQTLRSSILNLNSNGIIRTGSTFDEQEDNECGSLLVSASEISWAGPAGKSRELVSFSSSPTPTAPIEPFDILTILDSPNSTDNRDYLIESVILLPSGDLQSVTVYGGPKFPMDVGISARVSKSIYTTYNENGLNCSARPRYLRSNTPDVQVANPNAATIISSGIRASNIKNAFSNILSIEIDGEPYEIDLFNADYVTQTLDTVVERINQYMVEHRLNAFAYRVRALKCYELAITHILPNFSDDLKSRTLKITEASSHDAHEALGLGYILDREVEGLSGNTCHINGKLISSFGRLKKYSSESVALNVGTTNLITMSENFLNEEIREGDLCTIEGSSEEADNGTYRVKKVNEDSLILDATGSVFAGELEDDAAIFIQRCCAPVGELEFQSSPLVPPDSDGLLLIDIFMTDTGDINYKKRAYMTGHLEDPITGEFYGAVTDISKGFISKDDEFKLRVNTDGMASLEQLPAYGPGEEVYIASTGKYKIFSADKFNYVILDVFASAPPSNPKEITIWGNSDVRDDVMHLSRITYSTNFGFIIGSPSETGGAIPLITDKRTTGTVDDTIISENILERYIQGPRNELRGSGIIRDLDIKDVIDHGDGAVCRIDVNPGVAVINGVRVEYLGINDFFYNYADAPTSNFYVAIDGKGCLLVAPELDMGGSYISPFFKQNVAHIAYIIIDSGGSPWASNPVIKDLRLFVDHLDYKVIGNITVANDQRFGHFTDIRKAVEYSRRFSKMFPDMPSPSIFIKEGVYEVSQNISLEFDIKISGSGPGTIIKRSESFELEADQIYTENHLEAMFLVGWDSATPMEYGVTLENLTLIGREGQPAGKFGAFINVRHNVNNNSSNAMFLFNNLKFIAAPDYVVGATWGVGDGGPNQQPFHIGVGGGGVYQNISINNCYFKGVGYQEAVIYLNNNNTYKNISVSNCISTDSIDTGSGWSLIRVQGGTTLVNVNEVGCMITPI